jgi:hypothetical protein
MLRALSQCLLILLILTGMASGQSGFVPRPPVPLPQVVAPPSALTARITPTQPTAPTAPMAPMMPQAPVRSKRAPFALPYTPPQRSIPPWIPVSAIAGIAVFLVIRLLKQYQSRTRWVRIVATPAGEAPLDVRGAWVGLTLPLCNPDLCTTETFGVVTGSRKSPMTGYMVYGRQAVEILAKKAPWAAAWWLEETPHVVVGNYVLVFSAEVCELV